jgi:hypothetical protein
MMLSGRASHREPFFIGRVRQDRRPMDTSKGDTDRFDALFKEKFGWKARSASIFCTGGVSKAETYGTPYIIFPIMRYKYIWSPVVGDLFNFLDGSTYWRTYGGGSYADKKTVETYTDKDLPKAIDSFKEIMLTGNQYYAFEYYRYFKLLQAYWGYYGNKEPTVERLRDIEEYLRSAMYQEVPLFEGEK